ncbi:TPA: hypothetical protein O6X01_002920, partial [Staphylococcus aureus]|nr:hypothetical protein [Staphylococcus aureus]
MVNKEFYKGMEDLSKNQDFIKAISISEKQTIEQFEKELTVRYLIAKYGNIDQIKGNEDIHDYLTKQIIEVTKMDIDFEKEKECFNRAFTLMNKVLGEDSFRRYKEDKGRFMGAFSIPTYEVLIGGLI